MPEITPEALYDNNILYRELIENCNIAFFISHHGKITFINDACLKMFRYQDKKDVVGSSILERVAPSYRANVIDLVSRNTQGEEIPSTYELVSLRADGSAFPSGSNIVNLTISGQRVTAIFIADLTEHKKAEAALKESEKKYRELVDQASSIIFRWNSDGVITFFNEYAQHLFGFAEAEIIGKNIIGTIVDEANAENSVFAKIIKKSSENLIYFEDIEYENVTHQGNQIWIAWKNKAIVNEANELIEILSVGIDVTTQKNAEEKIKKSEKELQSILDSMQDTYYRVNQDGYIIRVSSSVGQLFGYTQKESFQIRLDDLYVEADGRDRFLQALVSSNGKITSYQAEMRHKDGSSVWVSTNAHFCFDKQGNVIGVEGTTRNISEKIKFEKTLRESEERFKSIFNSMSDAVIFASGNRQILLINPAVTEIFGYTMADLKDKYTKCLYADAEDYLSQGQKRYSIDASGNQTRYEMTYQRKDGSTFFGETFGTKIEDNDGNFIGFVAIIRDVSEKKKYDDKLRLSRKIFENAGKAILVTDSDENIIDINDAFCEITGYSKADLLGKPSFSLLGSQYNDKKTLFTSISDVLSTTDHWQGELWGRKKSGQEYPILATISVVKDQYGAASTYVIVFSDISDIKQTEKRLVQLAHYDQLTGLPNRMLFHEHLHAALARAKRHSNCIAIMYIDLDGFKQVNDTLGHAQGDELLIQIGERLKSCVREEDTVARLGGDEFAIIISELNSMEYLHNLAKRIVDKLSISLSYESRELPVTGSVGVATYPDDGTTEKKLLQSADQAMYHAKALGKNTYQFFDAEMNTKMLNKIYLEHDLRLAIKNNELFVQYQPKYDLQKKQVVGVEALVRWQHPQQGILQPIDFISLAEDTSLIYDLGKQVLKIACESAKKWHDAGGGAIPVAVNISAKQIRNTQFVQLIRDELKSSKLPASLLEIEITESLLMEDIEKTILILTELKEMGVSISIDDFGTGYSSLSYLKKLPVDTLKIDRSFVTDIADNEDDRAIVSAIISMAKNLNLRVIAEGVENEQQLQFLKSKLCHEIQGYLLTEPVYFEELNEAILTIEKKGLLF